MVRNEHILYFRLLDPRMVDSSIMFTKYVSDWATNLRAISLNVGVTTFGPPCILITGQVFVSRKEQNVREIGGSKSKG